MKTKEEIERLSIKKYPYNSRISALGGTEDANQEYRLGYQNGYTQCQQDNKPVDVEKLRDLFIKETDSFTGMRESHTLIFVDRLMKAVDHCLTNTSEDKEAFAVGFAKWIPNNYFVRRLDGSFINIGKEADGNLYSMNELLQLYKDSLPQPPTQTA